MNKKMLGKLLLGVAACIPLMLVVVIFLASSEGRLPFFKYVDTKFAPGYSHQAWDVVGVGMTKEEVLSFLGPPLTDTNTSSTVWWYSNDGRCRWGDFAWCAKMLEFSPHGIVTSKIDRWYND